MYRESFAVSDSDLDIELLLMTDRYTDEFAEATTGIGGTVFVNRLSRLVMDPERFREDVDEPMSRLGMGTVYMWRQSGAPLRRPGFSLEERNALIVDLYEPYHSALELAVEEYLKSYRCCIIVDLHSFPEKALPYEDASLARPQVCIGFDEFHVDEALRDRWSSRIREAGLGVSFNAPFAGSLVPSRFYRRDPRVRSMMIELRRDLYMNEVTGGRTTNFEQVQALVSSLISIAGERCHEMLAMPTDR